MDASDIPGLLSKYFFKRDLIVMIGASVGLISMFLPWIDVNVPGPFDHLILGHYGIYNPHGGPMSAFDILSSSLYAILWMPIALFALGLFVSMFTRLGGLVQAGGLAYLLSEVHSVGWLPSYGFQASLFGVHYHFMIGYFMALASTLIVMFGGRRFVWSIRDYGNVPATARVTALMPRATNLLRPH